MVDLVREDAQRLTKQLERHDALYRQVAGLRRELAPAVDTLHMRRRQEKNALAQVEEELRALKREGILNKAVRAAKELLEGGHSQEELLERRRLQIVERLNLIQTDERRLLRRYRDLVDREEALLEELYGEKPLLPAVAPWLLAAGAVVAALTYGNQNLGPFFIALATAASGALGFWWHARRHEPDRIFELEDQLWRRIRVKHDGYRDRLLEELDNVGVLLREFREPAADTLARVSSDDLGYYKSLVALLLELASRDDLIPPVEVATIRSLLEHEFGLTGETLEEMSKYIREESEKARGQGDLSEHLSRFRSPDGARLLVRLLTRVAFADGRYYGREETFIRHVARELSVPGEELSLIQGEERQLARARGASLPEAPAQAPVPADIAFVEEDAEEGEEERRRGRRRER